MGCGSRGATPISTNMYKADEDDQVKCMRHPSAHRKQSKVLCDYEQMKTQKIYHGNLSDSSSPLFLPVTFFGVVLR